MSPFGSRPRLLAFSLFAAIFALRATVGSVGDVNRALVYLFIGGLVGSFADRLRSLEAESARHFDLSLDMISTAGFDGCFKAVNPAFARILGYREEDLVGRPFLDFVHPDDRERTEQEAAALSDGRTTVQFQNRYFDSEGEVHWLEWASVPIPEEKIIYGIARDVTERKAMEEELERLSRHDPLTGVLNRRSFDEALDAQLNHARRYGRGGALLIADVDRFKRINDELGHAVGDEALRTVARVLDENLRSSDTVGRGSGYGTLVARLGGDEFAVLLSEADEAGADAAAQRLVAAVAATSLEVEPAAGEELGLSVSIGVACFEEHGCPPAQDLLVAADQAMYVVKAAGGGGASLAAASA